MIDAFGWKSIFYVALVILAVSFVISPASYLRMYWNFRTRNST